MMDDASGFYTSSRCTLAESIGGAPRWAVIAFGVIQPLSVEGVGFAFRELHSQQILAGRNSQRSISALYLEFVVENNLTEQS